MRQLSKIKLNQLIKSEVKSGELKKILGGACTNYNCECTGHSKGSGYVDGSMDATATYGYLP